MPVPVRPILLLTRSADDSAEFAQFLGRHDAPLHDVVISPLLECVYLSTHVDTSGVQSLIFTSRHGVAAYAAQAHAPRLSCHVVGGRTAEAARARGHEVLSQHPDAATLLAFCATNAPQGPVLHVRGEHARGDIAKTLSARNLSAGETVVYAQNLRPLTETALTALAGERPVIIPLFSPRTATQFVRECTGTAPIHGIALSAAVAEAAKGTRWTRMTIAPTPTRDSMVTSVIDTLSGVAG
ncbi:uroporphyrinogen-III synthase [Pseudaestuariivita sp.]|uniref:uroporphyrinogen-III synthase n=1 Tax=Pseudaestuariivita sp. TaxID=2211669 RepID=UPI00405A3B8B